MKIRINGDHRDFNEPLTLAELVSSLGMKSDRVAVELNREIVQRTKWTETSLREGDKLEIVHFVGGGCDTTSADPGLLAFRSSAVSFCFYIRAIRVHPWPLLLLF